MHERSPDRGGRLVRAAGAGSEERHECGEQDFALAARTRVELGTEPRGSCGSDGLKFLSFRERRQRDGHATENDLIAFFAGVAHAKSVLGTSEGTPQLHVGLCFLNARLECTEFGALRCGFQEHVEVWLATRCERALDANVALQSKDLFEVTNRECPGRLGSFTLGANAGQRGARDVHIEDGNVSRLEAAVGHGMNVRRELLSCFEQPDALLRVKRPEIGACRQP